jgi:hypothetical protein
MSTSEKAVRDIVKATVENHVSYELPYFTRLARSDDSWVLWRLCHQRGRSGPVAIGPSEMATVTGVIWIALNQAASEFGTVTGDGIFRAVGALLRRLLRRKPKTATIPALTAEQTEMVCGRLREALKEKTELGEKRRDDVVNDVFHQLLVKPDDNGTTKASPSSPGN